MPRYICKFCRGKCAYRATLCWGCISRGSSKQCCDMVVYSGPGGTCVQHEEKCAYGRKDMNMDSNYTERERERLLATIEAAQERLALIESIPFDDFDEGEVIRFDKQLGAKVYSYAAIKTENGWYTSGPKNSGPFEWDKLWLWLLNDCPVKEVWWLSQAQRIYKG